MNKKVKNQQSILDLALEHTGSIEAAFELAKKNNISPDQWIQPGTTIQTQSVSNEEVVEKINSPSTDSTDGGVFSFPIPVEVIPATDAIITLNGSPFITVPFGTTEDIQLLDQNSIEIVPNSVIGSEIIVTNETEQFPAAKVLQTGQIEDYGLGNDINRGRLSTFFKLNYENEWGHDWRFCGLTGGYSDGVDFFDVNGNPTTKALAFPEDLIFDFNSRGLDEVLTFYVGDTYAYRNFSTGLTVHLNSTFGGLTGWYLWNDQEMNSVRCMESFNSVVHWLGYSPFNFGSSQRYFITSTRNDSYVIRTDLRSVAYVGGVSVSNAYQTVHVRYTTLSELGL